MALTPPYRSFIQVPFLNLMSDLVQRGGQVNVRVGGNSQEQATYVTSLPNGKMIEKNITDTQNPVGQFASFKLTSKLTSFPLLD
jgi:hypothetical protein